MLHAPPTGVASAGVQRLRGGRLPRVAEPQAHNQAMAAQLAASDARLEAAQATLAVRFEDLAQR